MNLLTGQDPLRTLIVQYKYMCVCVNVNSFLYVLASYASKRYQHFQNANFLLLRLRDPVLQLRLSCFAHSPPSSALYLDTAGPPDALLLAASPQVRAHSLSARGAAGKGLHRGPFSRGALLVGSAVAVESALIRASSGETSARTRTGT